MNTPAAVSPDDETPSLKSFFLQAVLWLPLAFFFWWLLRSVAVFPAIRAAHFVLLNWLPELVQSVSQDVLTDPGRMDTTAMVFEVRVHTHGLIGNPDSVIGIASYGNALQYCYGLPVLFGLVMATPLDWTRTFLQWIGGALILVPVQAFGLIGDALNSAQRGLASAVMQGLSDMPDINHAAIPELAMRAQADAQATLLAHGLGPENLALWFQFGYLILPSLTPVVVWLVFNRNFIEKLTRRRELRGGNAGPSATSERTPP